MSKGTDSGPSQAAATLAAAVAAKAALTALSGTQAAVAGEGGVDGAEPTALMSSKPADLLLACFSAALALPLAVYATVGSFARYTADDYCWAGVLRTEGFFKAQALWYTGYSPRYAFTFLVNLVELAGPAIVPVLPLLAILTWLAVISWALAQFGTGWWEAILLAQIATLATFVSAPDLPQSLYWQTGMLTYLLPLVLASFLTGWVRRTLRQGRLTPFGLGVSGVVTFVAGGLSETYLIPQNVALTLAFAAAMVCSRPGARRVLAPHLAAALAGGVLALLTIVLAPSTASRVGGSPADLWLASSAAIATAGYQVLRLARYFPFAALLCLAAPGLLGIYARRVNRTSFLLVTACVALTVPFCYFPSFYAQNGNPPARSLIVPGAILVTYLIYTGYAFGRLREAFSERLRIAAITVALLIPVGIALVALLGVAPAAQHAALWDAEDAQIRALRDAGHTDVRVPPLPTYLGENFLTADPRDWFNVCVARYYGVGTLATNP